MEQMFVVKPKPKPKPFLFYKSVNKIINKQTTRQHPDAIAEKSNTKSGWINDI